MQDFSCVALQCSKQGSITIHNNETEFVVISQECCQGFCVELGRFKKKNVVRN